MSILDSSMTSHTKLIEFFKMFYWQHLKKNPACAEKITTATADITIHFFENPALFNTFFSKKTCTCRRNYYFFGNNTLTYFIGYKIPNKTNQL
jgi:hypothetical protein